MLVLSQNESVVTLVSTLDVGKFQYANYVRLVVYVSQGH